MQEGLLECLINREVVTGTKHITTATIGGQASMSASLARASERRFLPGESYSLGFKVSGLRNKHQLWRTSASASAHTHK